jgi:uncharacterized protein YjbJ (UPF0337 family)
MAIRERASNEAQDLKGRAKETAGKATGNDDLKDKGKADQMKAALKDVGEQAKDAANKIKDILRDEK